MEKPPPLQRLTEESDSCATEQDLLQAMLNHTSDLIYFKDRRSRFIRVNEHMARVAGWEDPAEAIGRSDFDIYTEEHASAAFADEQRIVETGVGITGKIEKETWPDGKVTWVSTSKFPLTNSDGLIVGTFGISRDVTASVEADSELARVNSHLVNASRQAGMAEVATGILHNVGNILNSTNLSAKIISDTLRKSKLSRLKDLADMIEANADDLGTFVTQDERGKQIPSFIGLLSQRLLQEQEKIELEMRTLSDSVEHIKAIVTLQQGFAVGGGVTELFSVDKLIDEALRIHRGAFSRHGVELVQEIDALPEVTADKHKLLQILVNLLRNAKSACDYEGNKVKRVVIRARKAGEDRIRIEVIDTGVGIPEENLTKVFSYGFTTRKDGHGFGLHSSALAAQDLGGSLEVHSAGPHMGATFAIEFPLRNQS